MKSGLPLNSLNTFVAAAEKMSFQKAAEALFVSSSAVSHQIRGLEKRLGYQLFERLDKAVRLTSRGEKLFNDARGPLAQLHQASRTALRGLEDNALSLSVAPIFATGWLLPRLKDFHAMHPEISLSVIASSELIDFSAHGFDASIRMGRGAWDNLISVSLLQARFVAVCHPQLVSENGGLLTPDQLLNHALVENTSMPGLWSEWFASCSGISSRLAFDLAVQNSAQVVEALQSGDSIGLVDQHFIDRDLASGRLALACEHVFEGEYGYFFTYPELTESLSSFEAFSGWLLGQLQED